MKTMFKSIYTTKFSTRSVVTISTIRMPAPCYQRAKEICKTTYNKKTCQNWLMQYTEIFFFSCKNLKFYQNFLDIFLIFALTKH